MYSRFRCCEDNRSVPIVAFVRRDPLGQPLERRRPITIPEAIEYGTTPAVSENMEHSFGRDLPHYCSYCPKSLIRTYCHLVQYSWRPCSLYLIVWQAQLTPILYPQLYSISLPAIFRSLPWLNSQAVGKRSL
jgi:hypothetical protein